MTGDTWFLLYFLCGVVHLTLPNLKTKSNESVTCHLSQKLRELDEHIISWNLKKQNFKNRRRKNGIDYEQKGIS